MTIEINSTKMQGMFKDVLFYFMTPDPNTGGYLLTVCVKGLVATTPSGYFEYHIEDTKNVISRVV